MDRRILIIDNDNGCLEMMTEVFQNEGFDIKGLLGTANIFDEIDLFKPHLVIIDYILEGVNGGELCHQLKTNEHTCHLPVVIISAHSKVIHSLGNYKSDHILAKPFDIFELRDIVTELIF
ncbi:PleD family two-component system response regulator [Mucilaginibacter sp.]|uniref:response regulator n=1 Tax=Mucilaginibacter sp. TaxID=1882438 RepID=UPI0035BBDB43